MRKVTMFTLMSALAFVGCVSSAQSWSKGIKDTPREATVCDKETVQVEDPENPGTTKMEYRIQLTWHDVERGTHPALWSVVNEKTYELFNLQDKVTINPVNFGQLRGHVTVIYYWTDDRMPEIAEIKYEFDLPEDPYPQ